jgi:phosphoglycerate dehydrogenase-like enzyme
MPCPRIAVHAWLPEGLFEHLTRRHPGYDWVDARTGEQLQRELPTANILYGLPPPGEAGASASGLYRLTEAPHLRWIQLISAGVPGDLCPVARRRGIIVTNLAGLYGNSIAEHALGLMILLARNFHLALRNQQQGSWDRSLANGLSDLHGRTLGIVGLGDIGRAIARLGQAHGMRTVGCRRRDVPTPEVDHLYPLAQLHAMLTEADYVVVAAPLIASTENMLGQREFAAMKRSVVYVNVSRGSIASEEALLDALRSGHVAAAGLDVFATEPLPAGHPLWTMPQVAIIPHVAGEVINLSARPAERFSRNLAAWERGLPLEGKVDLEWGY